MKQIGREGARRLHRAVSLFAVIQCWLRQLDGVAFKRPHLKTLLELHRFKQARINWLKEDFQDFFPHYQVIKRAGRINSFSSIIVSRVSLENSLPKGRMSTKQRIESIPAGGPRLAFFELPPTQTMANGFGGIVHLVSD